MVVPAPPARLTPPNEFVWPAGTALHRLHDPSFDGNGFNPCLGRRTRFAPIHAPDGRCIPSLYAGSTLLAAIFETVFHDIPPNAPLKTVPLRSASARSHSVLHPTRDLVLANLRAPDLKKWGLRPSDLITAPATHYAETARWAAAIHAQYPGIDGLIWTSNQCDPDDAVVIYGDRVMADELAIAESRDGRSDETLLEDIRAAGERAGIFITL